MNFISCKRDPHRCWGINDPVNLDHCLTYSGGIVKDRQSFEEKEKAHAILFTMVGCKQPITWTFVDERHRDWEMWRLQELSYVPRDVAGEMLDSGDYEVVPVKLQETNSWLPLRQRKSQPTCASQSSATLTSTVQPRLMPT